MRVKRNNDAAIKYWNLEIVQRANGNCDGCIVSESEKERATANSQNRLSIWFIVKNVI
jgi:hypothetical protein